MIIQDLHQTYTPRFWRTDLSARLIQKRTNRRPHAATSVHARIRIRLMRLHAFVIVGPCLPIRFIRVVVWANTRAKGQVRRGGDKAHFGRVELSGRIYRRHTRRNPSDELGARREITQRRSRSSLHGAVRVVSQCFGRVAAAVAVAVAVAVAETALHFPLSLLDVFSKHAHGFIRVAPFTSSQDVQML